MDGSTGVSVESLFEKVRGIARSNLGHTCPRQEASDLAQETAMALLPHIATLSAFSDTELVAYVEKAANSKLTDGLRHRKRKKRDGGQVLSLSQAEYGAGAIEPASDQTTPSQHLQRKEADEAIESLPDHLKQTLEFWRQDFTRSEIASISGISHQAVTKRMTKGFQELRRKLYPESC